MKTTKKVFGFIAEWTIKVIFFIPYVSLVLLGFFSAILSTFFIRGWRNYTDSIKKDKYGIDILNGKE